jgi:branched-chain amino acid aminotransferase
MSLVWVNGSLVAAVEACVSTTDRGFTLGDGLFEKMRVTNGRVFRLDAHLDRLRRSARKIALTCPEPLEAAVATTVQANDVAEGAVRLTLTRGRSPSGLRVVEGEPPTIVISVRPYVPDVRHTRDGVRAIIATGCINERGSAAGLKHLGYLEAILAQREADAAGVHEAILLDTRGNLAEAAAANLFVVNGDLLTPSSGSGILPGITRATVLHLAAEAGGSAREESLLPTVLEDAQEAFLTSSLRGIVPLVAVAGRPVGGGAPGPLTRSIQQAYARLVQEETGKGELNFEF